jgi:hypothetical protein
MRPHDWAPPGYQACADLMKEQPLNEELDEREVIEEI